MNVGEPPPGSPAAPLAVSVVESLESFAVKGTEKGIQGAGL